MKYIKSKVTLGCLKEFKTALNIFKMIKRAIKMIG